MNLTGNAENRQELRGSVKEEYFLVGTLNGLKKIRGYSAYEIALLNGFAGTEEEWLVSLRGEKGDPGAVAFDKLTEEQLAMLKGDPFTYEDFTAEQLAALKGEDGEDGKDGTSVTIRNITTSTADGGRNYVTFSSGGVLEVRNGTKGSNGINGKNGTNGADGVGIADIVFKESTAEGNVYTINLDDGTSYDFLAPIGPKGADGSGGSGDSGEDGEDGGYYVPSVDANGNLSWSASKTDMPPVGSANIKGQSGADGGYYTPSVDADGYLHWTPSKYSMPAVLSVNVKGEPGAAGQDGQDGQDGADGANGRRGTGILRITDTTSSSSGTGDNGVSIAYRIALSTVKSQAGVDEVLVGDVLIRSYYMYQVVKVDASYVYLSSYTSIRGATGASGSNGADGADGYTPVRGTDYWTADDIATIKAYVDDAILGGAW